MLRFKMISPGRSWTMMSVLSALVIIIGQPAASAAPPEKKAGGSKDIPLCVEVSDSNLVNVTSDGGGNYCHSKKAAVSAIVGRNQGQFFFETNTNLSLDGRSMKFFFPAGTVTQVFGPIGEDVYSSGFRPTNVWVLSAREDVGMENGYVDLRTMQEGDTASIAIRIQLELDRQNKVNLHYGDVLWPPGHEMSHVLGGALATVTAGPSTDGDKDNYSDSWIITGTTAWMNESTDDQSSYPIQYYEVEMPFMFMAYKK